MNPFKQIKSSMLVLALTATSLAVGSHQAYAQSDDKTLLGAGSSFVYPLFSKMFSEYNKTTGVKVNYQSIGSGGGILQLTAKKVDFGGSDAPLNAEQTSKMGVPVVHVPIASGATVIAYNLPGMKAKLKFTGKIIADIYLGTITKWNDPQIVAINKGVTLPELPIMVVHRSDGSGTTFIFTDYLTKVSTDWASKVGKASAVKWPVGLGGKGSEGVAGLVKQTPGAVGYVELAYALQNKMDFGQVQNKKGLFVTPNLISTTAAANVTLPADAKVSLTNTDAALGYPISSFTWALLYKEQNYGGRTQGEATQLVKLLWFATHGGQKYCLPLNYAVLSKAAIKVSENILKSVTYNGKPLH